VDSGPGDDAAYARACYAAWLTAEARKRFALGCALSVVLTAYGLLRACTPPWFGIPPRAAGGCPASWSWIAAAGLGACILAYLGSMLALAAGVGLVFVERLAMGWLVQVPLARVLQRRSVLLWFHRGGPAAPGPCLRLRGDLVSDAGRLAFSGGSARSPRRPVAGFLFPDLTSERVASWHTRVVSAALPRRPEIL
jgi:hypothetical protein